MTSRLESLTGPTTTKGALQTSPLKSTGGTVASAAGVGVNGVYWIGEDGNIWVKDNAGNVSNKGTALVSGDNYFDGSAYSGEGYKLIDNPNPSNPVGDYVSGLGSGGSEYKDTSASQAATQKSIDALDLARSNGLGGIADTFARIMAQYAEENELNKKNYETQVTSNEQTRTRNLQASLLAAAQGGRGMNATLSSLGALDGTGRVLANRAVADSANKDIGDGNKVFDANATQLNSAWDTTLADQKRREEEAILAKQDEEAAVEQEIAKQRQSLYEKMAGYKADAGDKTGADLYTRMMGDLAPKTVNARPAAAKYVPRNIGYEAGKLNTYLGGANDMTVKTSAGNSGNNAAINSPLYALTKKRDMELA